MGEPKQVMLRVTLRDGRRGYGLEGERFSRIFRTKEEITKDDVALIEGWVDGGWKLSSTTKLEMVDGR